MQSNALAFAELDGKLKNNSSVVLLIEWKRQAAAVRRRCRMARRLQGRQDERLLERDVEGAQEAARQAGRLSEDRPSRQRERARRGTWDRARAPRQATILEAILPLPKPGKKPTARAVVSTERGKYRTIPRGQLMTEIARRVDGATSYTDDLRDYKPKDVADFEAYERDWLKELQPPAHRFRAYSKEQRLHRRNVRLEGR